MQNWLDKKIIQFDSILKCILPDLSLVPTIKSPADAYVPIELNVLEKYQSAAKMRVNLAGEIAAQGLYRGQMLLARQENLKKYFHDAAIEELNHYVWCYQRLIDLDARPSIFNPLWYIGALIIGLFASFMSDEISLGFVIATEEQVSQHLASHLQNLPKDDLQSRAIVAKMYSDEWRHAYEAAICGGKHLHQEVQRLMNWAAQIMIQASSLI